MSIDPNTCPGCMETINPDKDDFKQLKEARMHHDCFRDAVRNKGQSYNQNFTTVRQCSGDCGEYFVGRGLLNMGLSYCHECAPESADSPPEETRRYN